MATKIIQFKDKDGNKEYPVTSSDAIGMSDGSGSLTEKLGQIGGSIAGKADIGSVFGGQKVVANGTSQYLEFTSFKSGLTLHLVNLRAPNSVWDLMGYDGNKWIKVQHITTHILVNTDILLPESVDKYGKIAVFANKGNISEGYGYIISDLDVKEAISKIKKSTTTEDLDKILKATLNYNLKSKFLTKKEQTILDANGNTKPYGSCYTTGFLPVREIPYVQFKNSFCASNADSMLAAFYDADKQAIPSLSIPYPSKDELKNIIIQIPENAHFARFSKNTGGRDNVKSEIEIMGVYESNDGGEGDIPSPETPDNITEKIRREVRGKADIGSVFGSQKVIADNTSKYLEFTSFKSGLTLHLVGLKRAPGGVAAWKLQGFNGKNWVELQDLGVGADRTKDVVLPKEVDTYERIAVFCSNSNIVEGYGYIISGLTAEELIEQIGSNNKNIELYLPWKGKRAFFVGDSSVVRGIPQGAAKYMQLQSYKSYGQNGQVICNFAQGMVSSEEHIQDIKDADITIVDGGGNDFGHGGIGLGSYYDERNKDKHLKFRLQLFRKDLSKTSIFDSIHHDGTFTRSGSIIVTVGTQSNPNGDSRTVTYTSSDTVDSVVAKIAALSYDGYTLSKDDNSVLFQRTSEGMNAWGYSDAIDYKIRLATKVDLTNAEEVECSRDLMLTKSEKYKAREFSIKMIQNGSGFNEVFGLSVHELLANNNAPNHFVQPSVCAAVKCLTELVAFFNPKAMIAFVSQPERAQFATDPITPPFSKSDKELFNSAEMFNKIEDTCKRLGVPYADCHSIGCTMYNLDNYGDDRLHLGGEIFARKLAKILNML